ncbi:MAG: alpha/beta fold hydrolase [Solirubrobacteraceae bacterium]
MPIADVNGHRIYYEDSGGERPAVVFSHGAFLDHTMWEPQVQALSGEYRCITWDERGCGMSDCRGAFTYWDSASDILALLDQLGIERAVFMGMSQGGWLSQRVALTAPERVRALVLQGTSVKPLSDPEREGYTQLSQGWLALGPVGEIAGAVIGIQFAGTDYDGSAFAAKWQGKPPSDWSEVWNTILSRPDDVAPRMGEIECPVLFIHGSIDAAFPVATAEEMSGMVPDSRGVVVIEGGPHALSLTHPEQVNAALRDFLGGL